MANSPHDQVPTRAQPLRELDRARAASARCSAAADEAVEATRRDGAALERKLTAAASSLAAARAQAAGR